jgi:hypothetical protein
MQRVYAISDVIGDKMLKKNYCATVCCMNLFSPMNSVGHNYKIHLQFSSYIISTHCTCILQMSRNLRSGARGNEHQDPLPPLTPPMTAELLQTVVEGQRVVAEAIRHMAAHDGGNIRQGLEPNLYISFKDFLDTKPPVFREAEEPLQADEWLNTIAEKFSLLRVTEGMKAS